MMTARGSSSKGDIRNGGRPRLDTAGRLSQQGQADIQHELEDVSEDTGPPPCRMEGPLEMRGPGMVGRWEPRWFRLDGTTLESFRLEGAQSEPATEDRVQEQPESTVSVRDVTNLQFDGNKIELFARGKKVRLRTKNDVDARRWREALESAQSQHGEQLCLPSAGMSPSASRKSSSMHEARTPAWGSATSPAHSAHFAALEDYPAPLTQRDSVDSWRADQLPMAALDKDSRINELHSLHKQKLRKLQEQRVQEETDEKRRLVAEKEALRRGRMRAPPSPQSLNPEAAANRLYKEHRMAALRLRDLQRQHEEDERRTIESARLRARPAQASMRSASTPVLETSREASTRLHQDALWRQEKQKQRQLLKAAADVSDSDRSVSARPRSATPVTQRHEELYGDAAVRRERLEKKREELADRERKLHLANKEVSEKQHVNHDRLKALHDEHVAKQKRHAMKMAAKQELDAKRLEDEKMEIKQRIKKTRQPVGLAPRKGTVTVIFIVQNIDYWELSNPSNQGVFADFRADVGRAIAQEAGSGITPDAMELNFSELTGYEEADPEVDESKVMQLQATINPATGEQAVEAQRRLSSSPTLAETVAAAMNAVDGIDAVLAFGGPDGAAICISNISVSPVITDIARQPQYIVKKPGEPSVSNTSASTIEPTSFADHLLSGILSAIQTRCHYYLPVLPTGATKKLLAPLKAATDTYRDATSMIDRSEGYSALSRRASQRIYNDGELMPEFLGWPRCQEPCHIRQLEWNLDDLHHTAQYAQSLLLARMVPDGHTVPPGGLFAKPNGVPMALFLYNPGVKTREAAEMKAFVRYQAAEGARRYTHLLDLARVTLVFRNFDELQSGLELILGTMEVVEVRNYFSSPSRLGAGYVKMQVVIKVPRGKGEPLPHVCEIKLEEMTYYKARQDAQPHLEELYNQVRSLYDRPCVNVNAILYLVQMVLTSAPDSHGIRVFRRQLARHYGSTVCCWRQVLGNDRLLSFTRFRDVCQSLRCRARVVEHWQELDAGLSGAMSLFELDPEAMCLLVRLRAQILAFVCPSVEDIDADTLFARFSFPVRAKSRGSLEAHEWRLVLKSHNFSPEEANRAFLLLDRQGGGDLNPPAAITVHDIWWLKRLPNYIDVSAVTLHPSNPGEMELSRSSDSRRAESPRRIPENIYRHQHQKRL